MTKIRIKVIFSTILIIGSLLAQRQTVGVEFNQRSRYIDSFRTRSNIWSISYRNELPSGMRLAGSLGLENCKFFRNNSYNNLMLKSSNQIFIQAEGLQKIYFMYFKGAVQFYSVKGNATEATSGNSEILHYNIYRIFEFPLSAGLTFPIESVDFYIGLNKIYFYGTNEKEILVNNSGNEISLGLSPRRTFQTDLVLGVEATMLYHYSDNLEFELNFARRSWDGKNYSVRLSIWGPLKRMIY